MGSRAVIWGVVFWAIGCAPVAMAPSPRGMGSDAGAAGPSQPRPPTPSSGGIEPLADQDGDGVPDVVEELAGTDPASASDSPRARGDFVFLVPYQGAPLPPRDTLVFRTAIRRADVYFMIDTSWSMQGDINGVRDTLGNVIFPGLTGAIEDVYIGAGEFDVCPEQRSAGGSLRVDCAGVRSAIASTDDVGAVRSAVGALTANCGTAEPYGQAVYLFATGDVTPFSGALADPGCPAPLDGVARVGIGCVRGDSLPILVVIGDEPYSEGTRCGGMGYFSPSVAEVSQALDAIGGKIIVMGPTVRAGRDSEWRQIAQATGSVDASGAPLLFPDVSRGAGLGDEIVRAVERLSEQIPLDVSSRARDLDDDGVDATVFIDRIEANTAGGVADPRDASTVCVGGLESRDSDADGYPDTFTGVAPGTPVCFDVVARTNTSVQPDASLPRVFRAAVDVLGEGVSTLDTRTAYFVVPPGSGGSLR